MPGKFILKDDVGIINQTQQSWRSDRFLGSWFGAFRAQPPEQKHRRCDGAAIAEGEANPPYAGPSPHAGVSNDPYLGTP